MRGKMKLAAIFALIAAMLVSFSACGGSQTSEQTQGAGSESTAAQVETTQVSAVNADGTFIKYEPAIDMLWGKTIDDTDETTINAITKTPNPKFPDETYEDNRYTRLWKDTLGINVKYKWVEKGDQAYQKLKMAMASGDLPDYFQIDINSNSNTQTGKLDFQQMAQNDLLEDLTDAYDKYATPLLRQILEPDGQSMILDTGRVDGKLYGIPQIQPLSNSTQYLFIRSDWLNNLGLQPPKTMDEFISVVKAFTDNDPDKNGKKDTVGLLASKEIYNYFGAIFSAYHVYPQKWYDDGSGNVVYGSVQPGAKSALKVLQDLYKGGYFDKEFGAKDWYTALTPVNAGQVGMFFGAAWMPLLTESLPVNTTGADLIAVPIPSADDKPAMNLIEPNTFGGVMVAQKGAANPEAIIKMADLWVETMYGPNAEQYADDYHPTDSSANIWRLSEIHIMDPYSEVNAAKEYFAAKGNGALDQLKGTALAAYKMTRTGDWGWNNMYSDNGPYKIMYSVYDANKLYANSAYNGAPTQTMQDKWSLLQDMEQATFTKIIIGEEDADSGFDKFVADWKSMGGDAITKEINDAVLANKAK